MTDIARHLNAILSILKSSIEDARDLLFEAANLLNIRRQLREALPESYGVGSGIIFNDQGQLSDPVPIIVYDRALADESHDLDNQRLHIKHSLLVIEAAPEYGEETLAQALAHIASVKTLIAKIRKAKSLRPPGQQRETIPTDRLPVGLIYCHRIHLPDTTPNQFLRIGSMIQRIPSRLAPDYVHALGQNMLYRNPLLDRAVAAPFDMGISLTPPLRKPHACYVCKEKFFRVHPFYDKLCVHCGDFNYSKRIDFADLTGKVALVTGARVRIGYEVALRLLRCGATVIATTRFPHDAARRYALEKDFSDWKDRLRIWGIDFRHTASLEMLIAFLYQAYPRLDILINNAAQTVRRPPAYYAHLIAFERLPHARLPPPLASLLLQDNPLQALPQAQTSIR